MTDKDRLELRRYAEHIVLKCPGSSSEDILSWLNSINCNASSDLFSSCTQTGAHPCHILNQLGDWSWNLRFIDTELREVSPGEFGLLPTHGYYGSRKDGVGPVKEWILVHWLLREHRCIKTLDLSGPFDAASHSLLSDALHHISGLRKVRLASWPSADVNSMSHVDVVSAVGTLSSVEELDLSCCCCSSPSALGHLGSALMEMSLLRSLMLPRIPGKIGDADVVSQLGQLIRHLMHCPNIAVLSSGEWVLEPDDGKVFEEFVAGSTTLRQLTLTRACWKDEFNLKGFFSAVAMNNSIEELHLKGFFLDEEERNLLAKVVAEHRSLHCLQVTDDDRDCTVRVGEGAGIADRVECNKSLRELVFAVSSYHCLVAFAEAIHRNPRVDRLSIAKVSLIVRSMSVHLEAVACNNLLRVIVSEGFFQPDEIIDSLMPEPETKGRARNEGDNPDPLILSRDSIDASVNGGRVPSGLLVPLLYHRHLKELSIRLLWSIETGRATSLAQFLSTANSLTYLCLEFFTAVATTQIILTGISNIRGLTGLCIGFMSFEPPQLDLLWRTVKSCDTLKSLTLRQLKFGDGQGLDRMPQALLDNHLLLYVGIQLGQFPTLHTPFQFEVEEVMRRNLSTLHRATQFVMGYCGRQFAVAFERVSRGLTLVEALKKVTGESEDEVRKRVRRSVHYLDEHFLVEAGVARHAIVCTGDDRAQLDRIGLDNWLCIRRYLKVTDIVLEQSPLSLELRSTGMHPAGTLAEP